MPEVLLVRRGRVEKLVRKYHLFLLFIMSQLTELSGMDQKRQKVSGTVKKQQKLGQPSKAGSLKGTTKRTTKQLAEQPTKHAKQPIKYTKKAAKHSVTKANHKRTFKRRISKFTTP